MNFAISPYAGAGAIKFGMTPDQVRKKLGVPYESLKRTPEAEMPCDYFEDPGLFVYYKKPGVVEAIEFASPAAVVFEGQSLLELPYKDLTELLRSKDGSLEVESDALTSHALGIGAYAPDAEEDPDAPVESIIVFERGYYGAPD